MTINGAIIVITGGASGIGKGMAERFAAMGAEHVIIADLDLVGAQTVAATIEGTAQECDVASDESVATLVEQTITEFGRIDYFFANAGVGAGDGLGTSDARWQAAWNVNVMGPVIAARHVIPHMERHGGGTFVVTASAAGLTTGPVSFNYAVSKHGAIGVAEWLAINHGPTVRVQAICPTIVDTPMASEFGEVMFQPLSVEAVVDSIVDGLNAGTFIIAPNEQPMTMFQAKANDWDGFIGTLQERVQALSSADEK